MPKCTGPTKTTLSNKEHTVLIVKRKIKMSTSLMFARKMKRNKKSKKAHNSQYAIHNEHKNNNSFPEN